MLRGLSAVGPGFVPPASHASGISGKLSVPVHPQSAIYARFRHVVGVSATDPFGGVSLYKLRILDNLIDNFLKSRNDPALSGLGEDLKVPVTQHTLDTVIGALSADLHEALTASQTPPAGLAGESGLVVSLGV
jgi:hypothetical protein